LLLKNLEEERDFDEFKYEEHAEELLRLRKTQQMSDEKPSNISIEEEVKEASRNTIDQKVNTKYSRRETQ